MLFILGFSRARGVSRGQLLSNHSLQVVDDVPRLVKDVPARSLLQINQEGFRPKEADLRRNPGIQRRDCHQHGDVLLEKDTSVGAREIGSQWVWLQHPRTLVDGVHCPPEGLEILLHHFVELGEHVLQQPPRASPFSLVMEYLWRREEVDGKTREHLWWHERVIWRDAYGHYVFPGEAVAGGVLHGAQVFREYHEVVSRSASVQVTAARRDLFHQWQEHLKGQRELRVPPHVHCSLHDTLKLREEGVEVGALTKSPLHQHTITATPVPFVLEEKSL
mmetsp:Transcript_13747/g.26374  ORF Transcript_13747/g.26374 Transcript_13747/m.26374 type:complete len:276 (+) Transcript_13747:476-1303(+)